MNDSSTPPMPALPPSSSALSKNNGTLSIRVVSANDLALPQQVEPLAVSLQVAGATVCTGPPSARHRSKNCFRFDSSQILSVNAPLATLYKSKALVTVEYKNSNDNLTAVLECKKLCIQETTSLTLKLKHTSPPEVTTTCTLRTTVSHDNDESITCTTPSLCVQVTLEGPLRTEIRALLNLAHAWFTIMDTAQDSLAPFLPKTLPSAKYLLIPSVPVLATVLVVSPIVIGISILFLPFVLPLFIVMTVFFLGWTSLGAFLLASSRMGRDKIATTCRSAPLLVTTLWKQPAIQIMIYDTGNRPTPSTLLEPYLPSGCIGKLVLSIVMDATGSASYLLPGLGESFDVVWCPCQTLLIHAMYQHVVPNLTVVSFLEEFLPFTDVLPSALMGWASEFGPQLLKMAREEMSMMQDKNGGMQLVKTNKKQTVVGGELQYTVG